tara:strand:+ start:255 stop:569 length:315 start_codon:yes stop_codon:yes gene_type:complete
MLAAETDTLIASRLNNLEKGVQQLDGKVAALDDKVAHVIQMNSELMIQSNENFRDMRSQLDEHRSELKKSIRQIKGRYSTRCQLMMFGSGLAAWTFFMAWVMLG